MARVLFIQNLHFESLGIEYLAAVIRKEGIIPDLYIYDGNKEKLKKYILKCTDLLLLAFPVFSYQHSWAQDLMELIKRICNVPIVIGGGHPTFFPEESIRMPNVDYMIRGEAEYPFRDLCTEIVSGKSGERILGVWVKRKDGAIIRNDMAPLVEDLDVLPFPDRSLYENVVFFKGFPVKRFLTRRGCPYNCSFCFNKQYKELVRGKGKLVRIRSPRNVIEELERVKKKYGMRTVAFTDDDFTSNEKWCYEFLNLYRKAINLPFTIFGKAAELNDSLVYALKEAGCHMFAFGVESGNQDIRNEILHKDLSDDQIHTAVKLLHKYKLQFTTFSMLGNPGESFIDAVETVKFNARLRPKVGVATVLNPYRETDIYKYCEKKGLIKEGINEELQRNANVFGYTVFLDQPDMEKIIILSKIYTMLIKFPSLIRICVYVIDRELLPKCIYKVVYYIFSALRQRIKLRLGWLEFIYFSFKIGAKGY